MPLLPPRPCSGGCGAYVPKGRCHACRKETRAPSSRRGYGTPAWASFRQTFTLRLLEQGIAPVCGAALPPGPNMAYSLCKAQGLLTYASHDGSSLHLDHDPPLEDHERLDLAKVCDLYRVGWLCAACHARKTATEIRGGTRIS